jgi:arylsulfatase A-like enzyme
MPDDRPIDGADAFPAFLRHKVEREKPCLWIFPTHEDTYFRMPQMAMRQDEYTLVGWFPEKEADTHLIDWMKSSVPEKFSLYNIRTDPGQEKDLSKEEPEKLDELIPEMVELWTEIRNEGPDWRIKDNTNVH